MQNLKDGDTEQIIWKDRQMSDKEKPHLYVGTPCHSEVSLHYVEALLNLNSECFHRKVKANYSIIKSSLVTQGRNLCVSGFLESDATHLLFIDSDISFNPKTIFKMLDKNIFTRTLSKFYRSF